MDEVMPTPPEKKSNKIKLYLMLATVGVMGIAFVFELYSASKTGAGVNMEMLNKLLDTLITLITASTEP